MQFLCSFGVGAAVGLYVLTGIALVVLVAFVGFHFIKKFW